MPHDATPRVAPTAPATPPADTATPPADTHLPPHLHLDTSPAARPSQVFVGENYRISVITAGLIRCEWSTRGAFEDRATQTVLNRDLGDVSITVHRDDDVLEFETDRLDVRYVKGPFTAGTLTARIKGLYTHHAVWRYGTEPAESLPDAWRNYGGTVRTLDDVDGATDLGFGFCSRVGYSTLDDAASLPLDDATGWVTERADPDAVDTYVVGYGHDFAAAVADVQRLTGPTPLLPRWALGTWWSRYHDYTEASYLELMDRFAAEGVPLTVAILDMDWHVHDVDPTLGTGWTGYTWDTTKFADPASFCAELRARGLAVGLNLHPADGIRRHEAAYADTARAMGVDPESGRAVRFDAANPAFWRAYTEHVLHPHERDGVDLWWVDWQQGTATETPGLDPLWALNHVHYLDSARPREDGSRRRGVTFSRYCGVGSHRYPVGFSGDTVVSWASLAFQPEFTASAANVAYGWWSHDIGGHLGGTTDPELYARWVQLGCFSPILRLHSTKSNVLRREPWLFTGEVRECVTSFLRLRHRLLPYTYTMNARAHHDGVPVVRPVYWDEPLTPEVSTHGGQFWFGDQLLVAPAVTPRDEVTQLTATRAWLPQGRWVDVTTGTVYDGGRRVTVCRDLLTYPVFGRAGAVVPLCDVDAGVGNPEVLELLVCAGADGEFTLYEDDDGYAPRVARTRFAWSWASGELRIDAATGDAGVVPTRRTYRLRLMGVAPPEAADGYDAETQTLTVDVGDVDTATGVTWRLPQPPRLADNAGQVWRRAFALTMPTAEKQTVERVLAGGSTARKLMGVANLDVPDATRAAILEILGARTDT